MTRSSLAILFALLAGPAAAGSDIAAFDLNGDRFVTFDEAREFAPGLTRAAFHDIDRNRDRRLSADELSGPDAVALVSRVERAGETRASGPLALPPVSLLQVDADRNGHVSFGELIRIDAPALLDFRAN